jgi:hypothetical protein
VYKSTRYKQYRNSIDSLLVLVFTAASDTIEIKHSIPWHRIRDLGHGDQDRALHRVVITTRITSPRITSAAIASSAIISSAVTAGCFYFSPNAKHHTDYKVHNDTEDDNEPLESLKRDTGRQNEISTRRSHR